VTRDLRSYKRRAHLLSRRLLFWIKATARSMGALRWNSSAAITKCSLTMWRGETVYDVIVDVKINNASRAAIGLGP
jgi:hypothetical protein